MHLVLTGLFQAKWAAEIHQEWIRNVLKNRADLTRERLERTRQAMNAAVRGCLVEGYAAHLATFSLPDANTMCWPPRYTLVPVSL